MYMRYRLSYHHRRLPPERSVREPGARRNGSGQSDPPDYDRLIFAAADKRSSAAGRGIEPGEVGEAFQLLSGQPQLAEISLSARAPGPDRGTWPDRNGRRCLMAKWGIVKCQLCGRNSRSVLRIKVSILITSEEDPHFFNPNARRFLCLARLDRGEKNTKNLKRGFL
jgi:hypothetical protein